MKKLKVSKSDGDHGAKTGKNDRSDPEVLSTAKRRTFTANRKLEILDEIDERKRWGLEIGSILRREGLYSAQISKWRKAREQGKIGALQQKKRGRKQEPDALLRAQLKQTQAENDRLKKDLEQAALIIDVQKKLSRLLDLGGEK